MAQPKDKKRKQKKRVARKPKGGAPLPKSVQALLKYLSGSGTGIGGAPSAQPTAAQQFQQAAPPPLPQPAGVPKPRAPRVKKAAASAPVPSPLQSIVPQAAAQTTIIQVPAAAPKQEEASGSQKELATLQATSKQQAGQIKNLQLSMTQQGANALNAQFFQDIQKQIQQQQQRGLPSLSLRSSQAPSYLGRAPSAPSFAGRTSMLGSEGGGEPVYESAKSRATSVAESQQTASDILEEEAGGLGAYLGGLYIQNVAAPVIPEKRMGRGRPAKSEEEKKATRAAAAQRRKEAKQLQKEQTLSQSLAQLSGLGAAAAAPRSVSSGSSIASNRAQQIFSRAQQGGADPSQTIRAMVAGGAAAAGVPQAGGGLSLGELTQKKKPRLVLKKKPE
jgi:hypothetical protein